MSTFVYSPLDLIELERTLSKERLLPYLQSTRRDAALAMQLYAQNTLLAESLYGILQGLEIALRNVIHGQLTIGFGAVSWWNVLNMEQAQASMVQKAKDALIQARKPLDAGRVVAELSFGFWTGLTGPKYDALWRNHLVKIFPRRPVQRAQVQARLNSIRKLRNRVAHHEPILNRPLQKDVNQIFDTISWMSPVTARWVRNNSSFDERYSKYREIFPSIGSVQQ
jgi:abortive infection bacteriophage resistance protein